MNKRPSTLFAGLALAATLVFSGCSAGTGDTSEVSASTSSVSSPVAELSYADLDIDEADLSFDTADAVDITLVDGESEAGSGASVEGDTVTIDEAGTYRLTGTLTSGSVVIDAPGAVVNLVLDGVDITAADVAAVNVVEADQVVISLADGSTNVLADAAGAAVDETVEDAPNATLFSSADLFLTGEGALSVTANAADAITSKDTLVMAGGDVAVTAADDGVRGKDHLVISGGSLTADVEGDALRSDNESVADEPDAAVGVIWIDGGTLDLSSASDAMDAARQVTVLDGDLTIAAGDDGIHSDNVLRIDGGTVDITESVEGIEGAYMYLSGGDVSVVASDDGINVSGGAEALAEETAATTDGAAAQPDEAAGGGPEGGPPAGGAPAGDAAAERAGGVTGPDDQATTTDPVEDLDALTVSAMEGAGFGGPAEGDNGNRVLELSGGTYVVDTTSDGVDVNGSMAMTGGTLVVSSTEDVRQGAIDVDDVFTISGGTLAANGMATMAVAPGDDSSQATLALTFGGTVPAGTVITIADGDGAQIASFTTAKASSSYIYSSDVLDRGADYTISVGGEVTGTATGWLVLDGTASGGSSIGTVAASQLRPGPDSAPGPAALVQSPGREFGEPSSAGGCRSTLILLRAPSRVPRAQRGLMRPSLPVRPVRLAAPLLVLPLVAGLLVGCSGEISIGGPGSISQESLEAEVRGNISGADAERLEVDCAGGLEAEPDATQDCLITYTDDDSRTGVRLSVTDVQGDEVEFDQLLFIEAEDVAAAVERFYTEQGIDVEAATCAGELLGEEGETTTCEVSSSSDGDATIEVTTTTVDGLTVNFDLDVAS